MWNTGPWIFQRLFHGFGQQSTLDFVIVVRQSMVHIAF